MLYELKLRATIIGYIPPLVVYGILKPLLGKTKPPTFNSSLILPLGLFASDLDLLKGVLLMR